MQAIARQPQRAPDGAPVHYERHRPEQTTRPGQKVLTVRGTMHRQKEFTQTLCADIDGFSLHVGAGVR